MYIDSVSGTLQSLNDTAGTLARMKDATVQNKIRQAELLNRMGENKAAEEMFNQAQHYGLSSLIAPNTQEWKPEGAFESPEAIQLNELNALSDTAQKGQNVLSAFGTAKGGVDQLAGLNGELYNGISSDMLNDGGKVIPQDVKLKAIKGGKAFEGELGAYGKETADNKQIEADNRQRQADNDSVPQFKSSYEGDEPDQLNQLADDTMAYIKFAESKGDYQGAAAAYNKYVQTGRSIADHYQHNFKPLGSEYFFSPKKGGGGGGTGNKYDNYMIKRSDGSKVSLQLPKGVDPDSKQGRKIAANKGIITNTLNYAPGDWHPESTDSSYLTEKEQQEANKIAADLDRDAKNEAQMAWDGTYKGIDIHKSPKDRADEANNILGPNSKYTYVVNQWGGVNMVERNGYSDKRNVVQSNPEDEVVF